MLLIKLPITAGRNFSSLIIFRRSRDEQLTTAFAAVTLRMIHQRRTLHAGDRVPAPAAHHKIAHRALIFQPQRFMAVCAVDIIAKPIGHDTRPVFPTASVIGAAGAGVQHLMS